MCVYREIIEQSLLTHIVPLPPKGDEEGPWVDRLLSVMRRLDEGSKRNLLHVAGLNPYVPLSYIRVAESIAAQCLHTFFVPLSRQRVYVANFVNACERNNVRTYLWLMLASICADHTSWISQGGTIDEDEEKIKKYLARTMHPISRT